VEKYLKTATAKGTPTLKL